jgi:Flp pilus assembly pilin Flp
MFHLKEYARIVVVISVCALAVIAFDRTVGKWLE